MSSREYFDDVASRWDEMRLAFSTEAVREKAYAVAGVERGKTAADVGAGSGFITEGLLQRGLRVFAIDSSEAMLAEMRRKFAEFEGIEYLLGDADRLPLWDETVDYVFANMVLHHVESPPGAIREMARILKPRRKLVITDLDKHGFEFLRTEHHDRWMGFRRATVARWFWESGLTNILVDCAGEDCRASSSDGDELAQIRIFIASGEK